MSRQIETPLFTLLSLFALSLTMAKTGEAQVFTTLHNFAAGSGYPSYTNSEGAYPGGGAGVTPRSYPIQAFTSAATLLQTRA